MLGDDELGEVAERLVTTWRQVLLKSKRCGGHLMENLISPSLSWRRINYCRVFVYIAYVIGGESAEGYIDSAR